MKGQNQGEPNPLNRLHPERRIRERLRGLNI